MKWLGYKSLADITSVVAGTNLSGGGTSGDVTVTLADASTSVKGAASFASADFTVSSGAVSLIDLTTAHFASPMAGPIEIEQGASGDGPALLIDNDDVDQHALKLEAANTTQTALQIAVPTLTTGNAFGINADALTTGSAIYLDIDDALTTAASKSLLKVDYDKSGVTGNSVLNKTTGLDINLADAATNHNNSIVEMIGAQIDVDIANNTGEIKQKGLIINVAADDVRDPAHTSGIELTVGDGATGGDLRIMSSADSGDYFEINCKTAGSTTLATVDDDGEDASLEIMTDGNIIFDAQPAECGVLVDATANTIADGLFIHANSLTTGSAISLDIDDTLTASATKSLLQIDYDKAGVTASSQLSKTTGLNINLADAATNNVSGSVTMIGAQVDVDSANATGTITQKGLNINVAADGVGDASITRGITLTTMDGATDIRMRSHADTGDYCDIGTTTHGATTITTVDDNATAAHFEIAADGDITLDSAGQIKLEPVAGNNILLDGTVAVDGGSVTGITTLGVDSVSLTAVQTSGETFADNDTSLMTSASVDDRINTAVSAGVGQLVVLRCSAFYINDNPLVTQHLYFGNSLGNQPMNWNDPVAVGESFEDNTSFVILGDDENWGIVLPFNISKIDIQCSLRPQLGTGDDFSVAIYTGVRSTDSSADLTLTKIHHRSVNISASANRYTRNDTSVTTNLDKGTMIYVGVGSNDTSDMKNGRGYMNITVTRRLA